MSNTGKTIATLLLAMCALLPGWAAAAVTATVDRNAIALGDTLRLTITATDGEKINEPDLRPLLVSFEILQRSSSSNYSLVNGRRSSTEQLLLDLAPKQEGVLSIPAMRIGKGVTNAIEVTVSSAAEVNSGGQAVLFEAELDRDSVYVQGQVILTLRLQQAINLDNRSVSELTLDDAFVTKLEQKSYQRNIDGRQWLVNEVRYALFPEQSGTLEIPAQSFTARLPGGRRTLFDTRGSGRPIQRKSATLSVEVLPVPTDFQGTTWLPARQLAITEHWSTPPEQLRAGESATRTIRIQAEGAQGAQLPPVLFTPIDGLKFYPDQPQISDQEISTGLMGTRVDSAAVVPTRAGNWTLPEIRVPWWDSQAQQIRYAKLPERSITVAPADPTTVDAAPAPTTSVTGDGAGSTLALSPASTTGWQLLTLFTSLGWTGTLLWLWRQRRSASPPDATRTSHASHPSNLSKRQAMKRLIAACRDNSAVDARQAVIIWASTLSNDGAFSSLQQVSAWFADPALSAELAALEASLYSVKTEKWSGQGLARCAQTLSRSRAPSAAGQGELTLYP